MSIKAMLFVALFGFMLFYLAAWWAAAREGLLKGVRWPTLEAIGFVTNFFDTLGIGSFATTTALFRRPGVLFLAANFGVAVALAFFLGTSVVGRIGLGVVVLLAGQVLLRVWLKAWLAFLDFWPSLVDDRLIPGTLNVGHTLPTIAQAFIYIAIVEVDMTTLVAMIAAAVAGAWLGAGIVSSWPVQKVRIGMGLALLVAATLFSMTLLGWMPAGGETLGLTGGKLALGVIGNFVLGALMSLGIGLYGPCMILISLLGMSPKVAFPIMMGSCAFLMPMSTARFLRAKSVDPQAALGLALGGVPAVLIAAYIVKNMSLDVVRGLVIVVVVYTAVTMLRTAFLEKAKPAA